jgi:hypothetical protein
VIVAVGVLVALGALFVLYIVLGVIVAVQGRKAKVVEAEVQREIAQQRSEAKIQIDRFEQSLAEEWPARHGRGPDVRTRRYLLMSRDQRRLALVLVKWRDELITEWEAAIDLAAVVSVELQQDETTVMKLETTGTTQKSGSLGRAAVGGILFGGAGAIVGATSAGSKTVATTTSTSQTLKGPVYLVIGTTNMEHPMHKVQMISRNEGEKWLHRIRGGLALLAEG